MGPKCAKTNPPDHYTTSTSLNHIDKAGWIHAFMSFTPNSAPGECRSWNPDLSCQAMFFQSSSQHARLVLFKIHNLYFSDTRLSRGHNGWLEELLLSSLFLSWSGQFHLVSGTSKEFWPRKIFSFDILFFLDHSLQTVEMVECEGPSPSAAWVTRCSSYANDHATSKVTQVRILNPQQATIDMLLCRKWVSWLAEGMLVSTAQQVYPLRSSAGIKSKEHSPNGCENKAPARDGIWQLRCCTRTCTCVRHVFLLCCSTFSSAFCGRRGA